LWTSSSANIVNLVDRPLPLRFGTPRDLRKIIVQPFCAASTLSFGLGKGRGKRQGDSSAPSEHSQPDKEAEYRAANHWWPQSEVVSGGADSSDTDRAREAHE
jgi:hypothetical protein